MPFSVVAGAMVAFQLILLYQFLPRATDPTRPRLSRAILIAYVLPATALMWAVIPAAVLRPSFASWWSATQAMMVPMPAPFFWMMSQLARAEERPIDRRGFAWPALLASAAIANEVLMGYAFAALAGAPSLDLPATAVALSANSPWFAASMFATMVGLILWVPIPGWERLALGGLAASTWVGPAWLVDPVLGAATMAVVMTATLVVVAFAFLGGRAGTAPGARFAYALGAAFAAMTVAGIASAALPEFASDGLPLAATGLAIMLVETIYLLRVGLGAVPDPTPPFRWGAETPSTA